MLRPLGYRSYHSGKWHVDGKPLANGFDHSYCLDDHDRHFIPASIYEDDQQLPPVEPGTGYYSTTAIADHAIKCLKEHAEKHADEPFFLYLAFTAPHFPLQAPPEDIARYREQYRDGLGRRPRASAGSGCRSSGSSTAASRTSSATSARRTTFPDAIKTARPQRGEPARCPGTS